MGFANTFLGVGEVTHLHPGGKVYDVSRSRDKATHGMQGWVKGKCLEDKGRDSSPRTSSQFLFIGLPSPLGAEVLKCATVWICPDLSLRNTYSELAFV